MVRVEYVFGEFHRAVHVRRPVRTFYIAESRIERRRIGLPRGDGFRLGSRNDQRNRSAVREYFVGKILNLRNSPVETTFAVLLRAHARRRIDNDYLLAVGFVPLVYLRGFGDDERRQRKHEYLTKQKQYVPQFTDGYFSLSVFKAEFPDERTGYHLLLVVRFKQIYNQQNDQTQKSQQP